MSYVRFVVFLSQGFMRSLQYREGATQAGENNVHLGTGFLCEYSFQVCTLPSSTLTARQFYLQSHATGTS